MSLAEMKPRTSGRVYSCKIATLIAADDDPKGAAESVRRHFDDEAHSNRALADWLGVHEGTVNKHRVAKNCACFR